MPNYQLHIKGLVQGVGFRPHVLKTARQYCVKGWVQNSNDGVYIEVSCDKEKAAAFFDEVIKNSPAGSIISSYRMKPVSERVHDGFTIMESTGHDTIDLLLPPDRAICPFCRQELSDPSNRRYRYPFITCVSCGPRYTIISGLPYDRKLTSMADMDTCPACRLEYSDPNDHRCHSQTQSCPDCPITLQVTDLSGLPETTGNEQVLKIIEQFLSAGKIVALKGIGGYLLLCDATSETAIATLRARKKRPAKPFAVLYPSLAMAEQDAEIGEHEKTALESAVAPVVICRLRDTPHTGISVESIAPGLSGIGVLLPYSPLLMLVSQDFNKPLVATSANLSGSPIIYEDEIAFRELRDIADITVSYNRNILVPADDSVVQFVSGGQPIWLRRARGLAPGYFPSPFLIDGCRLAMGAELKSSFALTVQNNLYISQYLGDQQSWASQLGYRHTLNHLLKLLDATPDRILLDRHPHYQVVALGRELAAEYDTPVQEVQHHLAHFSALLAEHGIFSSAEPILGIIWDGNGYGEDGQVWGGEAFLLEQDGFSRVAHLDYFPQLLGDKMNREPRLSAAALLPNHPEETALLKNMFSEQEWNYYEKLLRQEPDLLCSSMGRLLDGISAILGITFINRFEGEAAMKLEAKAIRHKGQEIPTYPIRINGRLLEWQPMLSAIIRDRQKGVPSEQIAASVFESLAMLVQELAIHIEVKTVAFSGGVFQNAFLVNRLKSRLQGHCRLLFHQRLSPNDECIGFGQLAYTCITNHKTIKTDQPCALPFQEK